MVVPAKAGTRLRRHPANEEMNPDWEALSEQASNSLNLVPAFAGTTSSGLP